MVIDIHCHVGLSARSVDSNIERFSFETGGACGSPGFDSYLSPRLLGRASWFFVRRWLGIDPRLDRGNELDHRIEAINERHWNEARSVDRLMLLAFDEYYDNAGRAIGMARRGQRIGSDLYVSNSMVRAMSSARPDRYLFGASIHPYRSNQGRPAGDMLAEIVHGGAKLVKWLPIHQNIDIEDGRSVAFMRAAAELGVPMLIHYGGEMSLARQHMEFESPIPLLRVLRRLRQDGTMPTVIVAHVATPSFFWQSRRGCRALVDALLGEFRDAPLYADISALAALGRTAWLRRFAAMRELHPKLVFGSDFPIPVLINAYRSCLPRAVRQHIASMDSWIEQDYQLKRALGFDDCVFTQAADILKIS